MFGSTHPAALNEAHRLGAAVRVLNPSSGTYHGKLYLGRRGDRVGAVVGSANLTGGLVVNVEAVTWMRGLAEEEPLRDAWAWAEERWADPRAEAWTPREATRRDDSVFEPELYRLLRAAIEADPVFLTLGPTPRRNEVVELTENGLYVVTEASVDKGTGAQEIPAWMFNLAWDTLRAHGRLANTYLLNELRVHRSSAVCAVLGRLPVVRVSGGRQIELAWVA